MKVNALTNAPVETKESQLYIVSGDKRNTTQFGKVTLDLSKYGDSGSYINSKIPFDNDEYPGAFIEVGLKGKVNKESANTSLNTSLNHSY